MPNLFLNRSKSFLYSTYVIFIFTAFPGLASDYTLTTNAGLIDATIYQNNKPGFEDNANTNYGDYARISATAWSHSGYNTYWRNLLKFQLDFIDAGTPVQSAKLYLYSDPAVTSSSASNGNSQLSGSNAVFFEKVTTDWEESVVTWNNQPTTTTAGRVWFPSSGSTTENIVIDITALVQDWVNNPNANYGMMMLLENELRNRDNNFICV